jgi:acyl carrier protein
MTNLEKYNLAFQETFDLKENELGDAYYQSVAAWDSIGHMSLIAALEESFKIVLDADDIVNFSSYRTGKTLLSKYGVSTQLDTER